RWEVVTEPMGPHPKLRQNNRVVTAVITFVQPECLILVKVLSGKQVDRGRLNAGRRSLALSYVGCAKTGHAGPGSAPSPTLSSSSSTVSGLLAGRRPLSSRWSL